MIHDPKAPPAVRPALIGSLAAVALLIVSVVPVLANPVPTEPDPPLQCEAGTGMITRYVTTLNMPADSNDWWVSVQVTIADQGGTAANCELTLATYELPSPEFIFPQTLHAADTGMYGAGTHTLTADLPVPGQMPDCFFQYDFAFGAPIAQLVFEDRYGDRQIRARIEPQSADQCPELSVQPTQSTSPSGSASASASASPSPRSSSLGGTPAASRGAVAGNQGVPNTSSSVPEATTSTTLAAFGGVLMLASLGSLALSWAREARRKN